MAFLSLSQCVFLHNRNKAKEKKQISFIKIRENFLLPLKQQKTVYVCIVFFDFILLQSH